MLQKSVLIPLSAGAVLATAAFVITRRARSSRRVRFGAAPATLENARESSRNEHFPVPQPTVPSVTVQRILPVEEGLHVSARPSDRAPRAPGPDDLEPLDADDLASIWLTSAAQSEHSLSEGEVSLDPDGLLDSLPAPDVSQDRPSLTGDE